MSLLRFFIFLLGVVVSNGYITCNTGYGQRGLLYEDGIAWVHTCPGSDYCFEVVTSDIDLIKRLLVFPWDPYFYQYYVRGCGGDWGMPLDYHPCKGKPISCRYLGNIKANITIPVVLTGEGGTEEFDLGWTCHKKDLCVDVILSGSHSTYKMSLVVTLISIAISLLIMF